jgi:hypothetical protein
MFYVWAAFESKSLIENIIVIVKLDFPNSNLGLMVWLVKLASLFEELPRHLL